MRLVRVVAFVALFVIPGLCVAQDCFDCVLGIWDDPALTSNRGTINVRELKEVYVGMKLANSVEDLSGVEFSISGVDKDGLLLVGAVPLGPRALVFGTIPAPQDTSINSEGVGGITAGWSRCLPGNQALFKLVLYATQPLSDRILQVKRSYPTTNFSWRTPILVHCDPPLYSISRVTGGCYVLNPSGEPIDCLNPQSVVAVAPTSWSALKSLYK